MPPPDLDKLKAAIIFLPTGESKWQFKAMEYFLPEEGYLAYFNQPTEWPYTKDKPRPIYEMVPAPALIAGLERLAQGNRDKDAVIMSQEGTIERLRGEVGKAKTLGAMSESAVNTQLLEALKAMDKPMKDLALYIDLEATHAAKAELNSIRDLQQAAIQAAEEK